MAVNNAVAVRRELLLRLSELFYAGELESRQVDRIPFDMRPKDFRDVPGCCVHKERAMLRYKVMALLGFDIWTEQDEMTPLHEFVQRAATREKPAEEPLTVVNDVCHACVRVNYVVTNMCRGCMARSCTNSCNRDAISFETGQAHIDHESCVNCGLCQRACPFHAIVYIPVPCEESCPVGAISKRPDGTEQIDYAKCTYCGRCIVSCPFGAVMEKSHIMDVFNAFRHERKVVAMVAPAIAGQFKAPLERILGAIRRLGFDDVIEVAKGADMTSCDEAEEFVHKIAGGQKFMTTSCCPSYIETVRKHLPELAPFVSDTPTPMQFTARLAREKHPDAVLVFVGPCLAKRYETTVDANADLMLSFEEIDAMLKSKGVDVAAAAQSALDGAIDDTSRGYPISAGVGRAVSKRVGDRVKVSPMIISGLDRARIKELRALPATATANMIEVMACEGGCVNGCNVIANPKVAARQVAEVAKREFGGRL